LAAGCIIALVAVAASAAARAGGVQRRLGEASRGGDARARRLQEGGRGNAGKGAGERSVYSRHG